MLNQIVLVGRIYELKGEEIVLSIPRTFKNENGEYDTDFISCVLWKGIAENTTEYCKKGDLVGVKGCVRRLENEDLKIIAEKVTFLSATKEK